MGDIYTRFKRTRTNDEGTNKALLGLQKLVKKRCTTIFIGALDSIEKKLGRLWGNDKDSRDLTEKEKLFLQIWKDLRKEILDKGNTQTKTLIKELEFFEIKLKGYSYQIELED